MVTKRRGSSDSSLDRSKRLRGPINPEEYQINDDDQLAAARSKSESYQVRGKERHSEDYAPHPRCVSTDDDTVSTTFIDTAEQVAVAGSYTSHDTGHAYSASTASKCSSICTENTTLPRLAQALAPTRGLLPWPDAEPSTARRQHYLAPLPIPDVDDVGQTGIKLSHDVLDNADDDEPKRSIESPASDRPDSRAHSPMETYTSPSLESSATPDPRAFLTVVGDDEVPSAYVDFALFMMERGTALFQWVQDAKARLQAMQARLSYLEAEEARNMASAPT
ncbi:hypothetical protein AC579_7855 [Pseudocercospora musae]|uniref:Uncharacterized protein n=1 Tax=Pseudocercospora musae TaxID=113226 RepID=A0A139HZC7_9PEZI|nr:hypothetical protein AC579_7855 [Pseudocercospora musae]